MFFQFTPDPETLRRIQEASAQRKAKEEEAPGPRMYQAADGGVVIDDPSLIGKVELLNEAPTEEDIDKVSIWASHVIGPNGDMGTWLPLNLHPAWSNKKKTKAQPKPA
ncbi:MAG TPA: hypothetical protein VFM18_07720 [Methanosarcina sp.]|nr:hypothetical protein [Methanosarcina sp.]